jgi:hypothetical protein
MDIYHITDGHAVVAEIDGNTAVSQHPLEWSKTPWTAEEAAAARAEMKRRYEEAQAAGRPLPSPPPPEPVPPTPEEQAAIDEHARAVAEARERLDAFYARKAKEKEEADQVARDEILVNSPPPQPDPAARRPFGRQGEPTPAEKAMMEKTAAKKAEEDKMIKDKVDADKLGSSKAEKHK